MKIIGQQTWDFLTRFKGDVYLESITESTQSHIVGIDADGKLYKQDRDVGDITSVTITTDSGGGSAASDEGPGSADFSILGSSGVNVTNSGTTITAVSVPGEIDHDSLLNFVAAEHYRWDTDISSTATIHTENITDLHGAGVDGANNQLLTDDGSGKIVSESGLTYGAEILTVGDDDDGVAQIRRRTHSDEGGGILAIYGGDGLGDDKTGGSVRIYSGASTGSASGGNIELYTARITDTAAANPNLTFTNYLKLLDNGAAVIGGGLRTNQSLKFDSASMGIYFEGGSYDTFLRAQGSLSSADRTITLPDASGTVALNNLRSFTKGSHVHFEFEGDVLYMGDGSTTQGDLCYLKENGEWGQADADGAATGDDADRDAMGMLAIALGDDPDVDGMLIRGRIVMDYDCGDCGNPIYVSTVAGSMTSVPPTTSGDFVRVVGYCLDDTNGQIYFNPDNTWVENA